MGKTELKIEVDATLAEQALEAGLDMTLVVERALKKALTPEAAEKSARRWAEENGVAIREHREQIERFGVIGEDLRTW